MFEVECDADRKCSCVVASICLKIDPSEKEKNGLVGLNSGYALVKKIFTRLLRAEIDWQGRL